jgi:hypothetical protein
MEFFSLQTPANARPVLAHCSTGNVPALGLGLRAIPTQISDAMSWSRQAKENVELKRNNTPSEPLTARKTPVNTIYDLLRGLKHEGILANLPARRTKPKLVRTIHDLIH